ncbi:MAG: hypothetical protein E2O92_00430, partial [Alphaproteobacteria bacterium]
MRFSINLGLASIIMLALAACSQAPEKTAEEAVPAEDVAPNSPTAAAVDAERLTQAASDGANWMSYGRTYDEQRHSPLTQVNADNVNTLGLAWSFD